MTVRLVVGARRGCLALDGAAAGVRVEAGARRHRILPEPPEETRGWTDAAARYVAAQGKNHPVNT